MRITFNKLKKSDYNDFCTDVCEIFSIVVIETFGKSEDGKDITLTGDNCHDEYFVFEKVM